jgi:hypothetical protein
VGEYGCVTKIVCDLGAQRRGANMGAMTILLGLVVPSVILIALDAYIQKRGQ